MSLIHDYLDRMAQGVSIEDLKQELCDELKSLNEKWKCESFVYATAMSKGVPGAMMISDDFHVVEDMLCNTNKKRVLVYLQTPGGSGETAERIAKFLHSKFEEVHFLVAGEAMSAGTILALSGDEIIMTESGSLGPIDAQMRIGRAPFSAHDYITWIDKIKEKVDEGKGLHPVDATILAQISPGELEGVHSALKFAIDRVEEWLCKYKFRNWTRTEERGIEVTPEMRQAQAKKIAEELTNQQRWRSHGTQLTINDLDELGLKVINASKEEALADGVERIRAILWVLFANSTVYKIFANQDKRIQQQAVPQGQQQPTPKNADWLAFDVHCPKCGKDHNLYAKFIVDGTIDAQAKNKGLKPFPNDNRLTCECGFVIDLAGLRNEIENQSGRKLLS